MTVCLIDSASCHHYFLFYASRIYCLGWIAGRSYRCIFSGNRTGSVVGPVVGDSPRNRGRIDELGLGEADSIRRVAHLARVL